MSSKQHLSFASRSGRLLHRGLAAAMAASLCMGATGCLSSLHRHGVAVAVATTPVIDEATTAYHNAQSLHDTKVDYETVVAFDATQKLDPATIIAFPSDDAIEVRLTVLEAFKTYVDSVVAITNGVNSPQLDASAKSVGGSLTKLGNTLQPTIEGALGITAAAGTTTVTTITSGSTTTTSSATAEAPLVSATDQSIIATSARALGEFLVSRKIKKELPQKIKDMDGNLKALCELMEHDLDILDGQEKRDFAYIRDHQMTFVQGTMVAGATALGPQEHRVQIMKLPALVRQQRATEQQLAQLRGAIVTLYMTHHALATAAQKNNPGSLKAKLGDLAAAGNDLGKFYASLSQ